MDGGMCTYELVNGQWVITDTCASGKACAVPVQQGKVNLIVNFERPVTNHDGTSGHITFTNATATAPGTVKVTTSLINKSVRVLEASPQTTHGASSVRVIDTVQHTTDGESIFANPAPTTQRLAVEVACEGQVINLSDLAVPVNLPAAPVPH
jgi:hypothetical protein